MLKYSLRYADRTGCRGTGISGSHPAPARRPTRTVTSPAPARQLAGQRRMLVQRKVRVQQETAVHAVGPYPTPKRAAGERGRGHQQQKVGTDAAQRQTQNVSKKKSKGTDGSTGSGVRRPPARQAADEAPRARPRPKRGRFEPQDNFWSQGERGVPTYSPKVTLLHSASPVSCQNQLTRRMARRTASALVMEQDE